MALIDPTTLADWLPPHSIEWYKQLSHLQGKYTYPWNSSFSEPNGESKFDKEVLHSIANKKVIDVGCGHGEFTLKCSEVASEIVGFDAMEQFINKGKEMKKTNVSFVVGSTKNRLPFERNTFDCAYIRKGPTSAYPLLKNVVIKGGAVYGLHPGDQSGKELPTLFPNLFQPLNGTPILDGLKLRLEASNFSSAQVEVVNSIEYIKSAVDVVKLRCFGQQPTILQALIENNINEITKIFDQNATENGMPITFSRYLVRARI
ncbi:class I SAM-dependent methyltransferase [Ureibacillus acetophenoni]|uniref:23S rRNA (Guanine745-N1)-methyltransferase n=1 Tax=Ureibacillus acetophenoni TaxID=614649 RepID=A0A285UDK9_9BACL|nr:methyltransferase domain-containing protein [Ureibacillus acetophenoni]SOC39922.1 23S rRNA (guanine745-N1)-methyltransferase [Ureibacillus acetophenoni]